MIKVRVKICGITRKEDLTAAIESGADAVGFVVDVPTSPRNLTLDKAEEMMRNTPIFVKAIAVTVARNLHQLTDIYKKLRPDALQIHGDSLPDAIIREGLSNARLIRSVQVTSNGVIKTAIEAANSFDAVLLDSYVLGKYGGTGKVHDWELSRHVREAIHPSPLILAGGLKPENVKHAVRIVQPYAVDVSSGVESRPSIKDPEKISKFIRNAKAGRI